MRSWAIVSGIVLWASAVAAGSVSLTSWSTRAGEPADAPLALKDPPADHRWMAVFLHSQCACSRATVSELARLMAHAPTGLAVDVYVSGPEGGSLLELSGAIPGVHAHRDDGSAALRYGARTSGQVLLYESGHLVFEGGITGGRGHEGDNSGSQTVLALLDGRYVTTNNGPVFGCALNSAEKKTQ
jgi:hypothetical protein